MQHPQDGAERSRSGIPASVKDIDIAITFRERIV